MDGHDEAPDDGGDVGFVPAEVMPGRAQAQHDDGIGGNGKQENQPAVGLQNFERRHDHEHQQGNKPDQGSGQAKDHVLVGFALQGLFGNLGHGLFQTAVAVGRQLVGVPEQIVDGDAELIGQGHHGQHVGDGFTPFPFGYGFVGII